MKKIWPDMGIILLLLGVFLLCLQGFNVIPVLGNLWLLIALFLIIAGFILYIIMNKHTKK